METENGHSPARYDILIMLGGLWAAQLFYSTISASLDFPIFHA